MKVRQNFDVTIKELDETTVFMTVIYMANNKVRNKMEFTIARHEGQSAEEVCAQAYPYAFEEEPVAQETTNTTEAPVTTE